MMGRSRALRLRAIAQNLGLLLGGLLIAVAAGELLIRYAAPQPIYRFPPGLYVEDAVLKYRLAPDFLGPATTGEYHTQIRTNSHGLREDKEYSMPKPPGTFRILAVGDSFTMGVGVELAQTWVKVLERSLAGGGSPVKYEVINAGVPGYDTSQEVAYVSNDGSNLDPDLVLLGFFVGNDVNDNYRKPDEVVIRGYLMEGEPRGGILSADARIFLQRNFHLYHFLYGYWHGLLHPETEGYMKAKRDFFLSIFAAQDNAQTAAMWEATWQQLRQLKRLVQERGWTVAVVIMPDHLQVDARAWQQIEELQSPGRSYRVDAPDQKMIQRCAELGLPALDLLPVFQGADRSSEMYFKVDGHWTAQGNALAAAAISDYLRKQALIVGAKSVPADTQVRTSGMAGDDWRSRGRKAP